MSMLLQRFDLQVDTKSLFLYLCNLEKLDNFPFSITIEIPLHPRFYPLHPHICPHK